MRKLKTVLSSYLVLGSMAGACYDAKAPTLPPCDKDATWPDPCAARISDAGEAGKQESDASRRRAGDAP